MVTLLTRNLWGKLRGMSAFTTVIVRISKTKTKRLTVWKKSARNLTYLVSSWIFFESKTDVSFGFQADVVVNLGLKEEINLLAANYKFSYLDNTSEFVSPDDFDGVEVILEQLKIISADYDEPRHVSSLFMLYKTCPLLFWLIYICCLDVMLVI